MRKFWNWKSRKIRDQAGAAGRYVVSMIPVKSVFPFLTLATNFTGAVLIGFLVGVAGRKDPVPPNAALFWKTGVCGGFTTFSTFSLEALSLFEDGSYLSGGLYVVLSVAGCIIGVFCGKRLAMLVQ